MKKKCDGSPVSVRGGAVHDAAPEAAGAVHLPLCRVSAAVELRLRHLGHIPALRAAQDRTTVVLHVSRASVPASPGSAGSGDRALAFLRD